MKIFKDQFFRISLDTGIDISPATLLLIKYIDPEGIRGEWTATLDPDNNNKMFYDVTGLTKVGRWKVWGKATFTLGDVPGEKAFFDLYEEGE